MRKRGRWADHPEILRQRSRIEVAKVSVLESCEMNSRTIYRRCLPGGPWRRLLPGIIQLSNSEPTRDQLAVAALLFAGPKALLTGVEACRRHGFHEDALPPEADIHVLVPHEHKVRSCEFVTIERTHRLPPTVIRDGFQLTPVVRATIDATRRIRVADMVGQLLIEPSNGDAARRAPLRGKSRTAVLAGPRFLGGCWPSGRTFARSRRGWPRS